MYAFTFDHSTQEAEADRFSEFVACLVFTASSRLARAILHLKKKVRRKNKNNGIFYLMYYTYHFNVKYYF